MKFPPEILLDLAACNRLAAMLGLPYRIGVSYGVADDLLAVMRGTTIVARLATSNEDALCDVLTMVSALNTAWAEEMKANAERNDILLNTPSANERPA